MQIVLFTHPSFLGSQSMPRFAQMIALGMRNNGHKVEVFTPQSFFFKLPVPKSFKKWLGYIDQYILFPYKVQKQLKQYPAQTLFVFADQALGPWVPLVKNRPHVIHCHDFLAQLSALGQIPENETSATGRLYQQYIRRGYEQGRNFISVSKKTQNDLHLLLGKIPVLSEVVYNGLNQDFKAGNAEEARIDIANETGIDVQNGFLLHVGGNQWYKNRAGVIDIYNAWRTKYNINLPLLMVGAVPNGKLLYTYNSSPYQHNIHLLTGKSDEFIKKAYCGASVFLFPSLAEGFGWPIAEAMASGCPVITTNQAPMTEVGGNAAFYIERKEQLSTENSWSNHAAETVNKVINLSADERRQIVDNGIVNAKRFDLKQSLNSIEELYERIIAGSVL